MSPSTAVRRVLVTGIGAITPLGLTFTESWNNLLRKASGATSLWAALKEQGLPEDILERELALAAQLPCQVAAPVRSFHKHDSRTNRFVQLALQAGAEAMQQAGLIDSSSFFGDKESNDPVHRRRRQRAGVCIGSGMSGVREIVQAAATVHESGYRKLSPHFVPKVLSNSAAGRLSMEYSLQGPNHSASTACAAGSHAIGDAMRMIQLDQADIMLSGGAEACIDPLSVAGFCRLRALSTAFNDCPEQASRPFDKRRDGFVMGEGAAVLVLEELQHALDRGADRHIMAELVGYGLSGDAHHITAPDPDGRGAASAMSMALQSATNDGVSVGYVNAHATSTPKGDEIEARVIHRVLGQQRQQDPLFVSSTKGATGHLLGAAGAIEAAFTVQALVDQQIPPTLNLDDIDKDEELGFQHVLDTVLTNDLEAAMSNSFGFGGTNASLLFKRIIR